VKDKKMRSGTIFQTNVFVNFYQILNISRFFFHS